ncbi:MAG: integration host factor subunit beta [Gammaproteobacteria bacterium]
MIKSELITQLSQRMMHLSEKDVNDSVNEVIDTMSDTLGSGGRIEIRGFGSFSLHYCPPRKAHNPRTGVKLQTHGKYKPHFKPGKELRERVNNAQSKNADTNGDSNNE